MLRPHAVAAVLTAFVATAAIPGSPVVAHRHEHGALAHVHGDPREPAHRHAGHDHDDDHHGHAAHHGGDAGDHRDGLVAWDDESGEHVHVVAPFQPATRPQRASARAGAIVVPLDVATPAAPPLPSLRTARSRGPPFAAHVRTTDS